eukprot:Gb_17039 [translate_table: standard]
MAHHIPPPPPPRVNPWVQDSYGPLRLPVNLHDMPDNYLKILPKFDGEKNASAEDHMTSFQDFTDMMFIEHDDWGEKWDHLYYLTEFGALKKKNSEFVLDFNKRERRAQTLYNMQDDAVDIEGNMTALGKINPRSDSGEKDKKKQKEEGGPSTSYAESQEAKIEAELHKKYDLRPTTGAMRQNIQTTKPKEPPQQKEKTKEVSVPVKKVVEEELIQKEVEKSVASFSLAHELGKVKIPIPLTKLVKIPTYHKEITKMLDSSASLVQIDTLNVQDESPLVVFGPHIEERNETVAPFYITLTVQDHLLHNCMLDSGASHNLMPKVIMEKLGLEVTRPYQDLYSFDSRKVKCIGMIKDLVVTLAQISGVIRNRHTKKVASEGKVDHEQPALSIWKVCRNLVNALSEAHNELLFLFRDSSFNSFIVPELMAKSQVTTMNSCRISQGEIYPATEALAHLKKSDTVKAALCSDREQGIVGSPNRKKQDYVGTKNMKKDTKEHFNQTSSLMIAKKSVDRSVGFTSTQCAPFQSATVTGLENKDMGSKNKKAAPFHEHGQNTLSPDIPYHIEMTSFQWIQKRLSNSEFPNVKRLLRKFVHVKDTDFRVKKRISHGKSRLPSRVFA